MNSLERPAEVLVVVKASPQRSREQEASLRRYAEQPQLLAERPLPPHLIPPRFEVRLDYSCLRSTCAGHKMRIIDWELTALQFRFASQTDHDLQSTITRNFLETPFADKKAPLIIVGNQENPQRRQSFTILGLYYPNADDIPQTETLF